MCLSCVKLSSHVVVFASGWLAATAEEYAQALEEVLVMEPSELLALTARARESVFRFSDTEFERGFVKCFAPVLNLA